MPERWLRDNEKTAKIHPYSSLTFGHGPRMCPGKRMAELEIKVAVCTLLKNFRLEWAGEKPLGPKWNLVNQPDQPVKFKFHPV